MGRRDKIKTIYLFRHGETDLNKNKIVQGSDIDSSLNDNGRKQAQELAEKLSGSGIECIYSSHLVRAFDTAKFVADRINVEIKVNVDLREISFGTFSGESMLDVNKKLDNNFFENFSKTNQYDDFVFPNGESKEKVRSRFVKCVENILNNTEYSIIGIASHGIALKQFYYNYKSEYPDSMPNCCVMKCVYDGSIKDIKII